MKTSVKLSLEEYNELIGFKESFEEGYEAMRVEVRYLYGGHNKSVTFLSKDRGIEILKDKITSLQHKIHVLENPEPKSWWDKLWNGKK